MDNRKLIAAAAVSSLLAAECAETVRMPEKQPNMHAQPTAALGLHLEYRNPALPSGDVTVDVKPLKLQMTLGAVTVAVRS
jgi:hypothetical protein